MIKKEILEKLYLDEEMTMHEIAEFLDVSVGSVYNYIKKYGIPSRPTMTEKTKRKISAKLKGKPAKLKVRKLSQETKKKISKSNKGKYKNPSIYGGHKKKRRDGYISVYMPDHPYATKDGYVMEHILVMENYIGRYITRDEVVHHINKIRDDNRIENLKLMTFKEHAGMNLKERWAERKEKNKNGD